MGRWVDATDTVVETTSRPRRIVSLVPSTTETLHALGAGERVVGVTRFCVHPAEARETAENVGGTKSPRLGRIEALRPDLIFANLEENRREDVEALRSLCPVYVAFPRDVPSAIAEIRAMGELLGDGRRAEELARKIEAAHAGCRKSRPFESFRFLYLVWRRPYLAAARPTFIDALLTEVSGRNAAPEGRGRYPEVSPKEMNDSDADVVFLSSEPFPFAPQHAEELLRELGGARWRERVLLVDGELLSWHGARLLEGLPYARRLAERVRSLERDGSSSSS